MIFDFITRPFRKTAKTLTLKERRQRYKEKFFSANTHYWIVEDPALYKAFNWFLDCFDSRTLTFLENSKEVIFLHTTGSMGSALSSLEKYHVIIVYPDLKNLLKSASLTHGMSVLAHELGHIIGRHSYRAISPLEAQVEADEFACRLGFGHELQDILLDQPESTDTRVRISYITTYLLTVKQAS